MSEPIYLEDLTPGRRFTAGPVTVDEAEVIAFAERYDPQPFHTDPEAAKRRTRCSAAMPRAAGTPRR